MKASIFINIPILLLAFIFSLFNNSFLVCGLFFISLIISSKYIVKTKDTYNLLFNGMLISLFFDYSIYVPHFQSIYLFHIMLFIFTIFSIYKLIKDKNIFYSLNKPVLAFLTLWMTYMCLSLTWCLNKVLGIKYIAIYLMMFAFLVDLMIYNLNKEHLKQTLKIVLFMLCVIIAIGSVEVLSGYQLPIRHYYDGFNLSPVDASAVRARGIAFSFNTNNFAAALGILSPLLFFGLCKTEKKLFKVLFFIMLSLLFALVFITTSRTGIFTIEIVMVIYFIYCLFPLKNLNIKKLIIPILIMISFTGFKYNAKSFMHPRNIDNEQKAEINNMLSDKMSALKKGNVEIGGEGSINERATIIINVLNGVILEDKNILGFGVGNTEQFLRNKDNTASVFSPHCYAIEILGDFGVFGVILYGIYYLYLLMNNLTIGIKEKNIYCIGASASLLCFSSASFGPSSITYVFSYWIIMAIAISCIQVFKGGMEKCQKEQ